MIKILNYTSSSLTLRDSFGQDMVLSSLGTPTVIRSSEHRNGVFVPLCGDAFDVDGLPDPKPDCVFVVDRWVYDVLVRNDHDRHDIFCPGLMPGDGAVYEDGRLVAVTRLVKG